MNYKLLSRGLLCLLLVCTFSVHSQTIKKVNFNYSELPAANAAFLGSPQIRANEYKVFKMDIESLKEQLVGIAHREDENKGFVAQVAFPHPDGTVHSYTAKENSTMDPVLAAMFPEIRAYDGHGTDGTFIKWDITPHGFHAMIMVPGESTIFIDPLIKGDTEHYIVYHKKDFVTDKLAECFFDSDEDNLKGTKEAVSGTVKAFGSCELRTYRLAVSATGEYTTFHGGTAAQAQAAQVTTINRVNGIYERDMAITMTIIGNNNLIIYTDAGTDPFTNGAPGTMINENQTNTDNVIGNGNYDIGHVFGTNSGGLAGLGVVCNNSGKARGVTGSGSPVGDPFDVDYVAHEVGHQFGANHTFNNSCNGNRNDATAVEPGSGSTIMAYAGICPPNVQSNSDDHFSGKSLEEIGIEITSAGHTCEVITSLTNSAPVVVSTNANVTIPANTPFALTAVATDADGDPLSYNWEQMDNDISTQAPVGTSTGGPNFKSFPSQTSPTRYFPNLNALNAGGPFTWEVLPTVTRTMDFRVTVRDNASGAGGCNDHMDVTLTTDAGSGPFVVNNPSNTGITWPGLSTQTVTWSVANTNVAPVACANVDILLSTDGGLTFPTTLASNVPNDGSQTISVPNTATTTAIVMVICSNGTFFDISDNNFTITAATNDYTLATTPTPVNVCQPNDGVFTVDIGSVGGYNDPVALSVSGVPAGATSSFSQTSVTPAGQSTLTISNTGAVTPGSYTLTVTATSTSGTKTNDVTLVVASAAPSAVTLTAPANSATGVAVPTTFTWTTASGMGVTYEINIATDAGFTNIVDQATGLTATTHSSASLSANTTYYWRVRSVTGCGSSAWSTAFSFTTSNCTTWASTNIPVTIPGASTGSVTSTINVPTGGTINDVNVLNLTGQHTYINDLIVTLTSPGGTTVSLWSQVCNSEDDFNLNFDDAAASGTLPCPPVGGGTYQPAGSLADFNGQDQAGVWTLTIQDVFAQDGGSLDSWSLEICVDAATCTDPDVPTLSGNTTICPGATTTLSVASGNLNDATNWQWYTGSCGGTSAGSGTSISVSPGTATTYYVRGEGGCVTPGTCASITVTPQDNTDPTITCPGNQTENVDASCAISLPDYTGSATVNDNCDASPTVTQSPAAGTTISGTGTVTTVTLTATDASGNSSNCTFTVTNVDNTNPTITCPGNQTFAVNASCQGSLPDYTSMATVGDNCDASPVVTQSPTAGTTISGTGTATTVTLTVTDASGNSSNCTFTATTVDNTSPSITCPGNQTENVNASCAISLPDYTGSATVNDNCDASPTVTQSPAAGTTISGTGTVTTVTLTATDASGNTSNCTFTVTNVDNTNPTITCPGNQTENVNASCAISLPDYTGSATVNDNCDASPTVTQSPAAGTTISGAGTVTTVTLTATDASGNTSNCTFTVTNVDNTNPTITCPGNQTENVNASCAISLPDYTGSATVNDNCDGSPTVTQSPAAGTTISGAGTVTTVTLTATDASGNSSNCTFTVANVDNTNPTITCPGNQTENFNASCQFTLPDYTGSATTSDNCDASPAVTQSPVAGTVITGLTTITLTSTDAAGNSANCTFDVIPNDATPPTITCPGNQTVTADGACQGVLADYTGMATAGDNCGTPVVTQSPAAGTTISTTTTVTLTATDGVNTTSCTFDVSILDNTNPTITCPGNQTENVDASCQISLPDYTSSATANDNCDASPTITQSPAAGTTISGAGTVTTVTLTATDASGNSSNCTFTVTNVDNTNPTITCPGNQTETFNASCQFTLPDYTGMATASDNCDASPAVTQSPAAGSVVTGLTTITLTATDAAGNSANCTFDVIPNDAMPPTITCPGNQTLTTDGSCQAILGDYTGLATAGDNCGTPTVTQSPSPGTTISTTTTVTLTASDGVNSTTCTFTVSLVDNTAPGITCGGNQTLSLDASCQATLGDYTGTASVVDGCDPSPVVTQSPAAGTVITGTTTVTLTATDVSGNAANCTFQVLAADNTAPTISCPGNQTTAANGNCQIVLADYTGSATVNDNCDASPTVTQSPAAGTTVTGVTTVTLTATDASGNTSNCTFDVTPIDNIAPVVSCPSDQTVQANGACEGTLLDYTSMATVTDACDAAPVVTQTPAAGTIITTTTAIILTATDAAGNTSTCTFNVSLVDDTAPVITCPGTQTICATTVPDLTGMASATDNCDASPAITQSPVAGTAITGGTVTVTLTATDASGNTDTCPVIVNVTSYNTTEDVTICAGETYTFPDGTTGTSTQSYTSVLTAVGGCDSIIVTNLTVSTVDVSTTTSGATITANASGASYGWIDCDNGDMLIAGETNQSFTPAQTGNYAVIVTAGNCSDTSACVLIDYTGVEDINGEHINIYPNPSSDQVMIEWNSDVTRIEVTDAKGKLVKRIDEFTGNSYLLEVKDYSNGVYFIHIESSKGRTVHDLLKQ